MKVGRNASEGLSLETGFLALGQGFHSLEASIVARANGECAAACRGRSPWQVIERRMSELGRPALLLK